MTLIVYVHLFCTLVGIEKCQHASCNLRVSLSQIELVCTAAKERRDVKLTMANQDTSDTHQMQPSTVTFWTPGRSYH